MEKGNKDIRLVEISNLKQQVGKILSQRKRERWGLTQYRLALSWLKLKPTKQSVIRRPEEGNQFQITDKDLRRFEEILTQLLKQD